VNCGASAGDEARFCSQCAALLDGATGALPTQERRQVTVFFSDLSGFTALNEHLDPEDVRDVVNKIWGRAGQIVERYEGRINKLLGDAVMAVFGDPVAHEDDPLRAVRAALELHEAVEALNKDVEPRIGSPIGMHAGVNTGVVLTSESILDGKQTGPLGDDQRHGAAAVARENEAGSRRAGDRRLWQGKVPRPIASPGHGAYRYGWDFALPQHSTSISVTTPVVSRFVVTCRICCG